MKLKLTEEQLYRANNVYFPLGVAELKVQELKRDYMNTLDVLKKEVGQDFQRWDPVSGETDVELPLESTAVEILPPARKKKKSLVAD